MTRRLPELRGYDHWKTANPEDEWLGPGPEDGMPQERGALTIWTIYDKPSDHPEGYIARRFEISEGGRTTATNDNLTGKLDDIRLAFEKAGFVKMPRTEGDAREIVESWV